MRKRQGEILTGLTGLTRLGLRREGQFSRKRTQGAQKGTEEELLFFNVFVFSAFFCG
jgi:hypothetical protein